MKISTEILARAVRTLRLARGETQVEMAHRIGVDPSTLYRWECGESRPHKIALRALADLCRDDETRAVFSLDIMKAASKIGSIPGSEVPIGEPEASRPDRKRPDAGITSRYYKFRRKQR